MLKKDCNGGKKFGDNKTSIFMKSSDVEERL